MGNSFMIKINDFLSSVTIENRYDKTLGFIVIVQQFNSQGFSSSEISKVLIDCINQRDIDNAATEVVIDVVERIKGFCAPDKIIKLI